MNSRISRGIIASAMPVSLALCAAPAWAADFEDANETPTLSAHHLTQSQLKQFSLDALDVGDPEPFNDMRSYGYYPGGMNGEEAKFCSEPWNWEKCFSAKAAADDALARAREKFDFSTLHKGKGDAYRHCYWSARMTIDMGVDTAKGFGDRHEAESSGADKDMDLSNNATGRSVGLTHKTHASASDRYEALAQAGMLVTLK